MADAPFAANPADYTGTMDTTKIGLKTTTVHREAWGDDQAARDLVIANESIDHYTHAFDGTAEERQEAADASKKFREPRQVIPGLQIIETE